MPSPAYRAALPSSRAAAAARPARRGLLPLAFALATVLAQVLLPLAHLEERRQAAREAGALLCAGAEADRPHLHAGSPREALPHDALHCAVCTATAQARTSLPDAGPRALLAPAPARLRPSIHAGRPVLAEAPRPSASPRAPPSPVADA